jgi:alkanesulfonate monooxygenase SsuD/methylene tetrahydromethanopterin reductase-like flavin-dependent oxidoreductase (luciferase family)
VVDTLGLDQARRTAWRTAARDAGLPAVAVLLDTPPDVCRARNLQRDRPVPASAIAQQLARAATIATTLDLEGWDVVHRVTDGGRAAAEAPERPAGSTTREGGERRSSQGLRFVLQVSRFPWGEEPATWLTGIARAADEAGFAGLALMDHLIQIPQVGRPWEPIPEPWVTLGLLAGLDTRLELGTLVTPVTFRAPGIVAKAAATLDALSGGRAFVGVGAGWWDREHAAYGIPFPGPRDRLDALESAIPTMRALWAPGTKPNAGLPETTCYPRPVHDIPIIVGGAGARMLDLGARMADAVNVGTRYVDRAVAAVAGTDVKVTVLDTEEASRSRYGALAAQGVDAVFLAVPDLRRPEDLERVAPVLT